MKTKTRIGTAFHKFLYTLSPLLLVEYAYFRKVHRAFNPCKPQTFDQKVLWMMLYWRNPLKSRCADKYAVRGYVEENGLGHLLPESLGVYSSSGEIDFDGLPERFVLKCTHGSGFNIFCPDKSRFDVEEAKHKLDGWMKIDISKHAGELHYASIKPRILCEPYLGDPSGKLPIDYKVYCFEGKAHCTMICTDRGRGTTKFDIYDLAWKNVLPYVNPALSANRYIPKPEGYEEMIEAAETLSNPFPFVRMDFYSIKGQIVFGEMTFTPSSGIDLDRTDAAQMKMGKLIRLPAKYRKTRLRTTPH